MKKLSALAAALLGVLAFSVTAMAESPAGETGTAVPSLLYCIPFAGILLCIALFPLVKPTWWEEHQAPVVLAWSLAFIVPFVIGFGAHHTA